MRGRASVREVNTADNGLIISAKDGSAAVPDLLRLFHENGVRVTNFSVTSPTLYDVFLHYTGRNIRDEKASQDEVGQMARPWLGLKRR